MSEKPKDKIYSSEIRTDKSQGGIIMIFNKGMLDIHRFGELTFHDISVACASLINSVNKVLAEEEYRIFREETETYISILSEIEQEEQ